jgi:hypothetical protein
LPAVSKELLKSRYVLDLYSRVYFETIPNVALISSSNESRTLVTVYLDMVDSLTEWTARFAHRIIHILVSASFKCLEQAHILVMSITIVLLL